MNCPPLFIPMNSMEKSAGIVAQIHQPTKTLFRSSGLGNENSCERDENGSKRKFVSRKPAFSAKISSSILLIQVANLLITGMSFLVL